MSSNIPKPIVFQVITNLGAGGAQRVFYDHASALSDKYAISEVVFDKAEAANLYPSGNPLFSLDVKGGEHIFSKVRNLFRRARNLRRLTQAQKPLVVISHMDGANWVNVLSQSDAKKILVVHGTVLNDQRIGKWQQLLRRYLLLPLVYNKASVTVAVSDGIKSELEYCGVKNVVSIPNFFDLANINLLAAKALPGPHALLFRDYDVLITSGRFSDQKKQASLLAMLACLKCHHKRLKLVLLGDGELRHNLIAAAKANGLSYYSVWENAPFTTDKDVYFLGYVANPFSYLSQSKLFLFPSAWEGFPMALCEAMICGVPVLAADCPTGPRQILAPQTKDTNYNLNHPEHTPHGMLLPLTDKPGALQQWVQTVEQALVNKQLCQDWCEAARKRITHFDKAKVLHQWYDLIDSLLPQNGKRAAHPVQEPIPSEEHAA